MPEFDSRQKHTQKVPPQQLKEIEVVEKEGYEPKMVYEGKNGVTRQILRIFYPVFSETKHTTITQHIVDKRTGQQLGYKYNTPDAYDVFCKINYLEKESDGKDGVHGSCSPTEFKKWITEGTKPKPAKVIPVDESYVRKVPKATVDPISKQAKANADVKIMKDIK